MHVNPKHIIGVLLLCIILTLGLTSCAKIDKVLPWKGDKSVSYEGGTATWVINKKKVYVTPRIEAIYTTLYDEKGEIVKHTRLPITENRDRYTWDWLQIDIRVNCIEVTFQPNETDYTREVTMNIQDGVSVIKIISIKQPCKHVDNGL